MEKSGGLLSRRPSSVADHHRLTNLWDSGGVSPRWLYVRGSKIGLRLQSGARLRLRSAQGLTHRTQQHGIGRRTASHPSPDGKISAFRC
jgi:hypothetical protein